MRVCDLLCTALYCKAGKLVCKPTFFSLLQHDCYYNVMLLYRLKKVLVLEYHVVEMESVCLGKTPSPACATQVSLERYARLTLMTVLKKIAVEMASVLMEWTASPACATRVSLGTYV